MRGRFAVTLVMLVACACCFTPGATVARANGPVVDRCLEYLNPYTPTEWKRCIGNEFNKFPDSAPELKDLYLHAPATGEWPRLESFVPGDNAPIVSFPYTDETGKVYVVPPGAGSRVQPFVGSGSPSIGYWWQTPTSTAPVNTQVDMYSSWQNYWMSHGATGYGGWTVPGGYTAAPW